MEDSKGHRADGPARNAESVSIRWACTLCGYHVDGEAPVACPECGAAREEFEVVPIPAG
ncbi:rubredoxin-like domain-containing protein [Rubrobacter indicoceani]|uniref:rubredoxin-like domain-containing protein n=1 Tax=Rubrobacter indicoceani TaxID=2051957 RepID=UPI0013C4CF96|nr:hypothetical protein [Rubrobacter indicoceani]